MDFVDQGRSKMAVGTFLGSGAREYGMYESESYMNT